MWGFVRGCQPGRLAKPAHVACLRVLIAFILAQISPPEASDTDEASLRRGYLSQDETRSAERPKGSDKRSIYPTEQPSGLPQNPPL